MRRKAKRRPTVSPRYGIALEPDPDGRAYEGFIRVSGIWLSRARSPEQDRRDRQELAEEYRLRVAAGRRVFE
jgi:hypothetical protein